MKGYALIDAATNTIKTVMSWGDKEINANYPLKEDEYLITLNEDMYKKIQTSILSDKPLKIKDKNADTFELLCEEIVVTIIKSEIIDTEKLALAEAIADLYERISILEGRAI